MRELGFADSSSKPSKAFKMSKCSRKQKPFASHGDFRRFLYEAPANSMRKVHRQTAEREIGFFPDSKPEPSLKILRLKKTACRSSSSVKFDQKQIEIVPFTRKGNLDGVRFKKEAHRSSFIHRVNARACYGFLHIAKSEITSIISSLQCVLIEVCVSPVRRCHTCPLTLLEMMLRYLREASITEKSA